MRIFYRISDASYVKIKLVDKMSCLKNFLRSVNRNQVNFVADNVKDETWAYLNGISSLTKRTSHGNAGALWFAIQEALEYKDELFYFVEDDYLHQPDPATFLEEALQKADYATLYDHPDKYEFEYQYGETTKVIKTKSSHWKYTCSTTMTFATSWAVLNRDKDIWRKYTADKHPHDHQLFLALGHGKLLSSIPGRACHVDMTYSGQKNQCLIDNWALELLNTHYE